MWVRGVQVPAFLYLADLESCQNKWSSSVFSWPISTSLCCSSYPGSSKRANAENPFNFLSQWKTLAGGLGWIFLPNVLLCSQVTRPDLRERGSALAGKRDLNVQPPAPMSEESQG